MKGQLQTILGRHRRRAGLHHDVGIGGTAFLDCYFKHAISHVEYELPELADDASEPQHRVAKVADAVTHQCPVRAPVDVVTVDTTDRRVEAVADSAQRCVR